MYDSRPVVLNSDFFLFLHWSPLSWALARILHVLSDRMSANRLASRSIQLKGTIQNLENKHQAVQWFDYVFSKFVTVWSFRIESGKYSYATPEINPFLHLPGKISGRLGTAHQNLPGKLLFTSLLIIAIILYNSNNIKLSKTPHSPEKKRETIKKTLFFLLSLDQGE